MIPLSPAPNGYNPTLLPDQHGLSAGVGTPAGESGCAEGKRMCDGCRYCFEHLYYLADVALCADCWIDVVPE